MIINKKEHFWNNKVKMSKIGKSIFSWFQKQQGMHQKSKMLESYYSSYHKIENRAS